MENYLIISFMGIMALNETTLKPYSPIISISVTQPVILGSKMLHPNMIVIADGSISRRHARIIQQNEDWYLEDLGSDNACWLIDPATYQRQRIAEPLMLQSGMQISLGEVLMEIKVHS